MQCNYVLPYPEVKSLTKDCEKLVVLLHGIGSDGNDLISLVPFIAESLPSCHFIAPQGVEPWDAAPYGRQWFSINNPKMEMVEKNTALLEQIIKEKQKQLNLSNKETIIVGFSQGAMIGLYLNFIQKKAFASVVSFSGRLITPHKCINNTTPVCLIHGEMDEVIDINYMDEIMDYLKKHNILYDSYKIPQLAHSIDARGLRYAAEFIKNQVSHKN